MKRILGVLTAIFLTSAVYAQTYSIDPNHSNVNFTIRHLVGHVTGHFDKFQGTFNYDPANPKSWSTEATIDAASINTGIDKRDGHLRSPDFFDVQKYPTLSFKSTGVTDVKGSTGKLHGDLTLHGVTKPVVLDLEIGGTVKNPMGPGERAGATATGRINRKDFGMVWNKVMDAGGLMVGEDVDIVINVEAVSKP
jgi:polyisoprenoid-binding protein YceI